MKQELTGKQIEIIHLIYRYRFLSRIQIQHLLHHKDYRRVNAWLKDLRDKNYLEWIYSTDFALKSKPAVYFLGRGSIRYLNSMSVCPPDEIRKRYKDLNRSQSFIDKSLLIADCCLNAQNKKDTVFSYATYTQADYMNPESVYHFAYELHPHLIILKQSNQVVDAKPIYYLLEVFAGLQQRQQLLHRLKRYREYVDSGDWEADTGEIKPPTILFACASKADLNYAKRRMRNEFAQLWDEDESRSFYKFTLIEELKSQGVTGHIWEQL